MGRMTATLAERLRDQAAECARLGSPLSAGLLAMAVEDLEAGGVVAAAGAEGAFERPVNVRLLELGRAPGSTSAPTASPTGSVA
jgi:hypothetical protein